MFDRAAARVTLLPKAENLARSTYSSADIVLDMIKILLLQQFDVFVYLFLFKCISV